MVKFNTLIIQEYKIYPFLCFSKVINQLIYKTLRCIPLIHEVQYGLIWKVYA